MGKWIQENRIVAAAGLFIAGVIFLAWKTYDVSHPTYGPPGIKVISLRSNLSADFVDSQQAIDTHPTQESFPKIASEFAVTLRDEADNLRVFGFDSAQLEDLPVVAEGLFRFAMMPELERDFAFFKQRGLVSTKEKARITLRENRKLFSNYNLAPFGAKTAQFLVLSAPNKQMVSQTLAGFGKKFVDVGASFPSMPIGSPLVEIVYVVRAPTVSGPSKEPFQNVICGWQVWWDGNRGKWIPKTSVIHQRDKERKNVVSPIPLGF